MGEGEDTLVRSRMSSARKKSADNIKLEITQKTGASKRSAPDPVPADVPPAKRQKSQPVLSSDPDPATLSIVERALSDNIKRFGTDGKPIPGPLVTEIMFNYLKKDTNGERTLKEQGRTGFPSGWAKGGEGRNVLMYEDANLEQGPHVFVVKFMSNVKINHA